MHKKSITIGLKNLILVAVLIMASLASAHTIKLFATVENQTISGYGYFPGGGKFRNGTVTVHGPDGTTLGQITTDDNGEFNYTAQYKCDHIFSIETTDGHAASYTVKAEELPDRLPPLSASNSVNLQPEASKDRALPSSGHEATVPPDQAPLLAAGGISSTDLERVVDSAIARHVKPLREQLEEYEQKIRLHDILSGIGYIFGVAGIAMYLASRKNSNGRNS